LIVGPNESYRDSDKLLRMSALKACMNSFYLRSVSEHLLIYSAHCFQDRRIHIGFPSRIASCKSHFSINKLKTEAILHAVDSFDESTELLVRLCASNFPFIHLTIARLFEVSTSPSLPGSFVRRHLDRQNCTDDPELIGLIHYFCRSLTLFTGERKSRFRFCKFSSVHFFRNPLQISRTV